MKFLYDVYMFCSEQNCSDLVIALAMFESEHPGAISQEEDKKIRGFIAANGRALARAFSEGDRAVFEQTVEELMAAK